MEPDGAGWRQKLFVGACVNRVHLDLVAVSYEGHLERGRLGWKWKRLDNRSRYSLEYIIESSAIKNFLYFLQPAEIVSLPDSPSRTDKHPVCKSTVKRNPIFQFLKVQLLKIFRLWTFLFLRGQGTEGSSLLRVQYFIITNDYGKYFNVIFVNKSETKLLTADCSGRSWHTVGVEVSAADPVDARDLVSRQGIGAIRGTGYLKRRGSNGRGTYDFWQQMQSL